MPSLMLQQGGFLSCCTSSSLLVLSLIVSDVEVSELIHAASTGSQSGPELRRGFARDYQHHKCITSEQA